MNSTQRLGHTMNTMRGGVVAFGVLFALTAAILLPPRLWCATRDSVTGAPPPQPHPSQHAALVWSGDGKVSVHSRISQTRFVQGESGAAFLAITIQGPAPAEGVSHHAPVDMVVVLDRSGSMSDPQKLPFAKHAIMQLISQLSDQDRFALVTFDGDVRVESGLSAMTISERARLTNLVAQLAPGGSTNISAGLQKAEEILSSSPSGRRRKVLLLSDGEANAGIVHPDELSALPKRFAPQEASVSTIGLGLGFNQSLLSRMADNGMGSYSYLETLNTLGEVLAQNLNHARASFASRSFLEFTLNEGVSLDDASGYPIEWRGKTARIPTGEILFGATKNLTLTLRVPTGTTTTGSIGEGRLVFTHGDTETSMAVNGETLAFAVVPPAERESVIASVDKQVVRESWLSNNFGLMQRKVGSLLQRGDRAGAKEAINAYRREVAEASVKADVDLRDQRTESELKGMANEIDDAFSGSADEQEEKLNRLAKKQHSGSIANQRR